MKSWLIAALSCMSVLLCVTHAPAQDNPPSTTHEVDNPAESSKFKETCLSFQLSQAGGCAELLFTGKPLHIAVGNLAPQNGFGAGLAFVGLIQPTETWRPSWNVDAVATPNGSWRAGVYFKFVHTPQFKTTVHYGKPRIKSNLSELPEHTVVNLYAQGISLNQIAFFGLGPLSTRTGRTYFGERETIVGGNAVKPVVGKWNISLIGEVNGRFVDIRPASANGGGPIESLYTEASTPGVSTQPGFLQVGESVRMRPVFWSDIVRLNYLASYQQFFSPLNSKYSFQRLTMDLSHDFALYGSTTRLSWPRDVNGPDECSIDPVRDHTSCSLNKKDQVADCEKTHGEGSEGCKAISRNLQGSVGLRFLLSTSFTPGGNAVPFYFQPTLGGGDINNNVSLPSFQDYRFRAPNILLFRQSFEHSLGSLPVGFAVMSNEGKVALARGDLGPNPWLHSFSAGLTLRAGGFPQVYLLFSWGGGEGTHAIANVNQSLLGGSVRPSLF
jgi:hypothetical protein